MRHYSYVDNINLVMRPIIFCCTSEKKYFKYTLTRLFFFVYLEKYEWFHSIPVPFISNKQMNKKVIYTISYILICKYPMYIVYHMIIIIAIK